jgi:hypothetical protein
MNWGSRGRFKQSVTVTAYRGFIAFAEAWENPLEAAGDDISIPRTRCIVGRNSSTPSGRHRWAQSRAGKMERGCARTSK